MARGDLGVVFEDRPSFTRPQVNFESSSGAQWSEKAKVILDRFLAHATIVPVTGKSYRLRQRASTTDD